MREVTRHIPRDKLFRLAELIARFETSATDAAAREALASLALGCRQEFPELTDVALKALVEDDVCAHRMVASGQLKALLEHIGGLSRIHVMIDWATSARRHQRVAIARALCSSMPILGIIPVLNQLADDTHPDVRRAACAASAHRMEHGRDAYAGILRARAQDDCRSVQLAAAEGLHRALKDLEFCSREGAKYVVGETTPRSMKQQR
jgi:HEAT repeat protein